MKEIRRTSLGEAWIAALREVHHSGQMIGDETQEAVLLVTAFEQCDPRNDPLLTRYGSSHKIDEMRKVFFSGEDNIFGHSYRDRLQGPRGARDLSDVVDLLAREPWSKRAVVTLIGLGDGRVPCINAIHFLRRDDGLEVNYFARGQDMFNKFYADAVCIHEMAERVAAALSSCVRRITGIISSAHIYLLDLAEIRRILADAAQFSRPAALIEDIA
jgi:thymidylate synthase